MSVLKAVLAVAVVGCGAALVTAGASAQPSSGPAASAPAAPSLPTRRPEELKADPMRALDIDKDGTVDLAEVRSAAAARFDKLNPDQDDSLDEREAAPVLQGQAFRQADSNGDGKVSKVEYLAYVERMFLLANPDKDGTLDRAELGSPAGQALLRLLR